MNSKKIAVTAVAVMGLLSLSACSSSKKPMPSKCTPPVKVVQVAPAKYKYVRVKVKTQPAQYIRYQRLQTACSAK